MPHSVRLPASACAFLATVEVGTNGADAKTAPITLAARSTSPVYVNEELGRVVHDFEGMRLYKSRIALDYCHDKDKVIGYANKFSKEDYGLVANGALIPYSADPLDKATEVIYKSGLGAPYEASIYMGEEVIAEKVKAGAKASVNGGVIEGPATIFREWTLRGIAVCPYGKDQDTFSGIALSDANPTVSVTFKEEAAMPLENKEETKPAEAEAKAVDAKAENDKPAYEAKAVDPAQGEAKEADQTATEAKPETVAEPAVAAVEATALSSDRKELRRFITEFGAEQGAKWFDEGKAFDEGQSLFLANVRAERDQFAADNKKLREQLAGTRGEKDPVSFSAAPEAGDEAKPDPKKFAHLGKGISRFVANMKFKKS